MVGKFLRTKHEPIQHDELKNLLQNERKKHSIPFKYEQNKILATHETKAIRSSPFSCIFSSLGRFYA